MLNVIPVSVFSTLRGMKARCADCGSVSVVQPSTAARIVSASVAYASTRLSIGALAQHALAADAASRRARSCVFQRQYLLQCGCHLSVAAPLKRNPLDRKHRPRQICAHHCNVVPALYFCQTNPSEPFRKRPLRCNCHATIFHDRHLIWLPPQ